MLRNYMRRHFTELTKDNAIVTSNLKGKCHGNLVSYQKLQNVSYINTNLKILAKVVVDCHPSVLGKTIDGCLATDGLVKNGLLAT